MTKCQIALYAVYKEAIEVLLTKKTDAMQGKILIKVLLCFDFLVLHSPQITGNGVLAEVPIRGIDESRNSNSNVGMPATLFPIKSGNKVGYIDRQGRIIIDAVFDDGRQFSEGVAPVNIGARRNRLGFAKGGKWGYVSAQGSLVCNPRFENALPFRDGLASVRSKLKWRLIGGDFQFVTEAKYDMPPTTFFRDGYALVKKEGGEWMYIDQSGKVVLTAGDVKAGPRESEVQVLGPFPVDGEFGFVDLEGNLFVKPQFTKARHFREGLAMVWRQTKAGYLAGFINQTGVMVIEPQFEQTHGLGFNEGLCPVIIGGRWGYIDKSGTVVIKAAFDLAGGFSEGLAPVNLGGARHGKWGFIDKAGKYTIHSQFHWASAFHDGIANVKIGKFGNYLDAYVDTKGNVVWQEGTDIPIKDEASNAD